MLEDEPRRREDLEPTRAGDVSPSAGGDEPAADARRTDDAHFRALARARQRRVAKVVAALVIILLLIIFIVANAKAVPVSFVFGTGHPKLIWVMLACALLGGIAGYLIGRPSRHVRFHETPNASDAGHG